MEVEGRLLYLSSWRDRQRRSQAAALWPFDKPEITPLPIPTNLETAPYAGVWIAAGLRQRGAAAAGAEFTDFVCLGSRILDAPGISDMERCMTRGARGLRDGSGFVRCVASLGLQAVVADSGAV